MRPRKRVVLLARSQEELSFWRMRIELGKALRVLPALTLGEALSHLDADMDARVVLTQVPDMSGIQALKQRDVKVLLFDCGPFEVSGGPADRYEVSGPQLVSRVLEDLRIMTAGKRGPKHKCMVRTSYSRSTFHETTEGVITQ